MSAAVDGVTDVVREVWEAATTAGPVPDQVTVLVTAGGVLVALATPWAWHVLRHVLTVVHEGAHGLVALLAGRRLAGIRLHSDTSGLTVSYGWPRGPGMVATLLAGYPGPALVGVGVAALVGEGYAAGALWAGLLATVLMLLQVRNAYGLLVLVVGAGSLVVVTWWAPIEVQTVVATVLAWLLLLGAPRAVVELGRERHRERRARRRGTSDVDQLAELTRLPAGVWTAVILLVCGLALVAGGVLLGLSVPVLSSTPG